ncbi:MAG: MAPEG family protein [Rickettsiales bacterium]|nr:MAPEG family protein [Pseudomonadota bacterium]MDA0966009.1 MAPEG family protein [Pseudomonadota bacterium]MDG4542520.1 MAPEG family protein [Rickettsiales bacterium]MDG4545024.1 MAPEG family protein [Rickettsiales bacterium]MDG4547147.1 MAPEG family protein [Rickettsiales bacterium]
MVTSLYAGLLAFLLLSLSIIVIKGRRQEQTALGSGGSRMLEQRIRAQANLAEYTPIVLILLFAAETQGVSIYLIHLIGLLFFTGRVVHAYALISFEKYDGNKLITSTKYRKIGMVCTFLSLAILASTNIIAYAYKTLQ